MIPLLLLPLALPPDPYPTIPGTIVHVRDGDTVVVRAHLPFDVHIDVPIRVEGVYCPETRGLSAKAGKEAKTFTEIWAMNYTNIVISADGDRSFDRWVSPVCLPLGGMCLSDALIEAGLCTREDVKK